MYHRDPENNKQIWKTKSTNLGYHLILSQKKNNSWQTYAQPTNEIKAIGNWTAGSL